MNGNDDGADLPTRLPLISRETIEGIRFAMIHGTGPTAGRAGRAAAEFPAVTVLVAGHGHVSWDTAARTARGR